MATKLDDRTGARTRSVSLNDIDPHRMMRSVDTAITVAGFDPSAMVGLLVGLPAKVGALVRIVGRGFVRRANPLLIAIDGGNRALGPRLLDAEDLEHLHVIADELMHGDPEFDRIVREIALASHDVLRGSDPERTLLATSFPSEMDEIVGVAQRAMLDDVDALTPMMVECMSRALVHLGPPAELAAALRSAPSLAAIIGDPEVPPEIAAVVLHCVQAMLANFALGAAVQRNQRLEPWLARALVEMTARGAREALGLIAARVGMVLPPGIAPSMDLRAIEESHRQRRARSHADLMDARARGTPIHPAITDGYLS